MNEYQAIKDIINFLLGIQLFIVFAFIIQFVANIVIISQLPKIKRYERLLYLKAYGFEDDDNEDIKNKKSENKKTRYNYKFVKDEKPKDTKQEKIQNLIETLDEYEKQ